MSRLVFAIRQAGQMGSGVDFRDEVPAAAVALIALRLHRRGELELSSRLGFAVDLDRTEFRLRAQDRERLLLALEADDDAGKKICTSRRRNSHCRPTGGRRRLRPPHLTAASCSASTSAKYATDWFSSRLKRQH